MANFSEWKADIYNPIYKNFQQKIDDRLKTKMRKAEESLRERGRDFVFNDVLESPLGIVFRDIFVDYIEIPCISCGESTEGTRNHTYPRSSLVNKFLSKDGHLYEFHLGTEREVMVIDGQEWAHPKGEFTKRGEKNVSIFHGFCNQCDYKIFKNADSKDITDGKPEAVFQQLYRVLCSIYHEALRHTVIHQCLVEEEKRFGLRVGPHSVLTHGRNPVTGDPMNPHQMILDLLYESYRHYNLMRDFNFDDILARPEHFKGILEYRFIEVRKPSVIGSFLILNRKRKNIKVNGIIREVEASGVMGIVYPISKTITVCLRFGLPLGIHKDELISVYNEFFSSYIALEKERGYEVSLSKTLVENLISGKNLLLSTDLFNSLSEGQRETLRFAYCDKGNNSFPEVNLFFQ